jgi:hypothetical protein
MLTGDRLDVSSATIRAIKPKLLIIMECNITSHRLAYTQHVLTYMSAALNFSIPRPPPPFHRIFYFAPKHYQ